MFDSINIMSVVFQIVWGSNQSSETVSVIIVLQAFSPSFIDIDWSWNLARSIVSIMVYWVQQRSNVLFICWVEGGGDCERCISGLSVKTLIQSLSPKKKKSRSTNIFKQSNSLILKSLSEKPEKPEKSNRTVLLLYNEKTKAWKNVWLFANVLRFHFHEFHFHSEHTSTSNPRRRYLMMTTSILILFKNFLWSAGK